VSSHEDQDQQVFEYTFVGAFLDRYVILINGKPIGIFAAKSLPPPYRKMYPPLGGTYKSSSTFHVISKVKIPYPCTEEPSLRKPEADTWWGSNLAKKMLQVLSQLWVKCTPKHAQMLSSFEAADLQRTSIWSHICTFPVRLWLKTKGSWKSCLWKSVWEIRTSRPLYAMGASVLAWGYRNLFGRQEECLHHTLSYAFSKLLHHVSICGRRPRNGTCSAHVSQK